MDIVEISKSLGQKWAELSDEQKAPFFKLYEGDKVRYGKELEQLVF
jgi:ABC-type transporter MlaC component